MIGFLLSTLVAAQAPEPRLVMRGESLLARGRWGEAGQEFSRALAAGDRDSLAAILGTGTIAAYQGRTEDARAAWLRLVQAYNRRAARTSRDLVAVASALERLAAESPQRARDALAVYDQAASADPRDPEPRLRAAELLLSRYNAAEARDGFLEVRRRWPLHPRALLGLAEVTRFLGEGDPAALAESSLVLDPGLERAHVFLARLTLETDDWASAETHLGHALALNPRSREAGAVRAALGWLRGDSSGFAAMEGGPDAAAQALVAAADAAARTRRYHDAVLLARRAVLLDTLSWRGWAMLGTNLLRRGDMPGGRAALERAFRGDPFDLWTKNTLDLLDTLGRYPEVASEHFRFVIDGRESALLTLYAAPLAEQAYRSLAARYGIEPPAPIRVEMFPTHADFSVRAVGLAGLGALGVCFGPVIAMDSPSARDRGQFSWVSTLWHEIAHVFHLELSHYRVPRWLTEGLAVLEQRRAPERWGEAVNPAFLEAWYGRRLPPLSRLNEGFIRPADAEALSHAYLLASYAAEWMEARWGEGVTPRVLAAFGEGLDLRTATGRILGLSLDSLDSAFEAWMDARFAGRRAALGPNGLAATLRQGHEALRAGNTAAARAAFERAKAMFPEYAGPDNAYRPLARLAAERGDRAAAAAELAALVSLDESAYDAAVELSRHLEATGSSDAALRALERVAGIWPLDPALHQRLAGHYERQHAYPALVRERRALLALGPTDRGGAWYDLARALALDGRNAEARRAVVRSLETAPGFGEAQELLLRLVDGRP